MLTAVHGASEPAVRPDAFKETVTLITRVIIVAVITVYAISWLVAHDCPGVPSQKRDCPQPNAPGPSLIAVALRLFVVACRPRELRAVGAETTDQRTDSPVGEQPAGPRRVGGLRTPGSRPSAGSADAFPRPDRGPRAPGAAPGDQAPINPAGMASGPQPVPRRPAQAATACASAVTAVAVGPTGPRTPTT